MSLFYVALLRTLFTILHGCIAHKNYILLGFGCRRVCCCVCTFAVARDSLNYVYSRSRQKKHGAHNVSVPAGLLPFQLKVETREWKEEGTKGCHHVSDYIREKNSWIYKKVVDRQDGQRLLSPGLLVVSLQTPGQYHFLPPSLLVFFFCFFFFRRHFTSIYYGKVPATSISWLSFNAPFIVVLGWLYYNRYGKQSVEIWGGEDQTRRYSHIFVLFFFLNFVWELLFNCSMWSWDKKKRKFF